MSKVYCGALEEKVTARYSLCPEQLGHQFAEKLSRRPQVREWWVLVALARVHYHVVDSLLEPDG